jgi:hypothetical protein
LKERRLVAEVISLSGRVVAPDDEDIHMPSSMHATFFSELAYSLRA